MNNEWLLLIKKHTDTLIEQTKRKPQETLEFKMIRSKPTFSFNPAISLVKEGKWLLRVTLFDCTNSLFEMKTTVSQLTYQLIGKPNLMQKLSTTYINY